MSIVLLFFLLLFWIQASSPTSLGFLLGGGGIGGGSRRRRRRVPTVTTTAFQQQQRRQQARSSSSSGFITTTSSSTTFTGLALLATGSKNQGSLGFGGSPSPERQKKKKAMVDKKIKNNNNKASTTAASSSAAASIANVANNKPYVKSQTDDLIAQLQAKTAKSCLGLAVAEASAEARARASSRTGSTMTDPFWEFIPALVASKFPNVQEQKLQRIAGFLRHAVHKSMDDSIPLKDVVFVSNHSNDEEEEEEEIFWNPHRPPDEIHAYMPGLGPTRPFHDANELKLCRLLSDNFETIRNEYHALLQDNLLNLNNNNNNNNPDGKKRDRFQSVTSMNYKSGWKTMVLFYNGHRIPGFPYHLCPTTTRILETVPLAGRIAGFNRQDPKTGIPLHTDGNNMWLTCQMGIQIPDNETAYITVGPETRHWQEGKCLVYDTTYRHETMNGHESQERVVLHVDFFNTLCMTSVEIAIMQYIYSMREEFMKAEGVVKKVGAQIL